MTATRFLLLLLAGMFVVSNGCTPSESAPLSSEQATGTTLVFQDITSPAHPGSRTPRMHTTNDGAVLLSWLEPRKEGGYALLFSRLEQGLWSTPKTIAGGEDWFANWAAFPSLIALDDGSLAAHFLTTNGKGTDVHVTQSADGGQTWHAAVTLHTDGTKTDHAFVSMLATSEGRLFAAWLDGRNTGEGSRGAMTLRAATLDNTGTRYDEVVLDDQVCSCCQTSATRTANGFLVAYRDRSDEEIRDIAVVRWKDGAWSAPQGVYEDGWQIAGCPVNGPAIAAAGEQVALAWFTAAGDIPRVKLSFSMDEGASFGSPVQIDDGNPLGRVHTVLLPDGSALVSWLEKTDDGADIRLRRVHADGTAEASSIVAATSTARASGFPRMTRKGKAIYMAWTVAGKPSSIRTAVATFADGLQ